MQRCDSSLVTTLEGITNYMYLTSDDDIGNQSNYWNRLC